MQATREEITAAFKRQAAACMALDAPFTARICRVLDACLDDGSAFAARVRAWPQESLTPDLMPLRGCAALNTLVRQGRAPELAALYPPHAAPDDDAALRAAILATVAAHDAEMTAFLASPPQTNEVARSGVLLGGFLTIAQATRMPLELLEPGASAGLNMLFDRYRYDLGEGRLWGPADGAVDVACEWRGPAPDLATPLAIVSRAAVDLKPVDARAHADRERMLAYIWPEQTQRIRRIEAALDLVAASGLAVAQGDAVEWLRAKLAAPQTAGVCRTVYHSVFLQYLPADLREELRATVKAAGEQATPTAPFAWAAMEAAPDRMNCELRLTLWPGGERRTLASVSWHGQWAEWA